MIRTTSSLSKASAVALCLALTGILSQVASGASISYGNFPVPPSSMAINVTESSGTDTVPLYGPPTPFPTGLNFNPTSFVSSAVSGGADITDGQLNLTFMSPGLKTLSLHEAGDYTLLGGGTAATSAFAGAILRATVTEINGAAVAPIVLAPANASVGFNLAANSGVTQPWSLGTSINIAGQLAAGQNATKVEIQINNQLDALSQPGTIAFIAKKEFILTGDTGPVVPEPATMGLAGLALCGLGIASRKRS
jgi:hypothetical protein